MFPAPPAAAAIVGVDVGGTFTDAVVVHEGRVVTAKLPTTPEDQSIAVVAAVVAALERAGLEASAVTGFRPRDDRRHECAARGHRAPRSPSSPPRDSPTSSSSGGRTGPTSTVSTPTIPPPIVPRERRIEVRERCGPHGVIEPLDAATVDAAVEAGPGQRRRGRGGGAALLVRPPGPRAGRHGGVAPPAARGST